MTRNTVDADDVRGGLKLLARSFALLIAASLLWHAPVGDGVLRWLFIAIALCVFVPSGLGLLVSAAVWRSIAWRGTFGRMVEWRGGKLANLLLAVPPLIVLCLSAALVFFSIGRLMH